MSVGSNKGDIKNVEVNVGVIGSTKQGKSSLVNRLLQLRNTDPGAAKVIAEEESVEEDVKKFTHPKFENIFLWDLPGVNSSNRSNYEKLITNRDGTKVHFDLFIVVFKDVLNNAVTIDSARLAESLKAKILFVRTHFDTTLDGVRRAEEVEELSAENIESSKKKVKQEIFVSGRKQLQIEIADDDTYLVDTSNWKEYDLQKLYLDFVNKSFLWIVDKKYQLFKKRIAHSKVIMGMGKASIVFEGKVNEYIIKEVILYLNAFELTALNLLEGINEKDLDNLKQVISKALQNNELAYNVWNSTENLKMGGWKEVKKYLKDEQVAEMITSGSVATATITSAAIAGKRVAQMGLVGVTAGMTGPAALVIAVASLTGSVALYTAASAWECKKCSEISEDALHEVRKAAIAKETFIADLELISLG